MYTVKNKRVVKRPNELTNRQLFDRAFRALGLSNEQIKALYDEFKSDMNSLKNISLEELQHFGLSKQMAYSVASLIELLCVRSKDIPEKTDPIMSSQQMAKRLVASYGDLNQEHLVAIYLDTQNRIIAEKVIFKGSVRRSVAEPREILHYGVKYMATSLVVTHNHPSGETYPSRNDVAFTDKMRRACKDLGIDFLDHIIVGKSDYYSFREEMELVD